MALQRDNGAYGKLKGTPVEANGAFADQRGSIQEYTRILL